MTETHMPTCTGPDKHGSAYVRILPNSQGMVHRSVELIDGRVIADYTPAGQLIGIEILGLSVPHHNCPEVRRLLSALTQEGVDVTGRVCERAIVARDD